jgi:hypothetical protein
VTKWERFNLSLPGRILIAKTMLYSQTNYLGSVLPIMDKHMCKWEDQIHKFVNGNLKLGNKKNVHFIEIWGIGAVPYKRISTITKT